MIAGYFDIFRRVVGWKSPPGQLVSGETFVAPVRLFSFSLVDRTLFRVPSRLVSFVLSARVSSVEAPERTVDTVAECRDLVVEAPDRETTLEVNSNE